MKRIIMSLGIGFTAFTFAMGTGIAGEVPKTETKVAVFTMNFDQLHNGVLPRGWEAGTTSGHGEIASWTVVKDPSAPSAPNILKVQPGSRTTGSMFNLYWTKTPHFSNSEIEVSLRGDGGSEDQGGGPAWRVLDKDNYYVARYNPLENNFRLYVVKNGNRRMLKGASGIRIGSGEWFTISVSQEGPHIECSLNGKKLLETDDSALKGEGGIGVWTKADAASSFDDLRMIPSLAGVSVLQK